MAAIGKPAISGATSVAAPTKGINDTQPLASMEPGYCIYLKDFYPNTSDISLRAGYKEWCTGMTGAVKSLAHYVNIDGVSSLFAFTNAGVYDVTVEGQDTFTPEYVITQGLVSTTQYTNLANNYLFCANGVDSLFMFDGTTWAAPAITGVTLTSISGVASFKNRLWFIEKDTMTAWFLGTDAIAGAASPFYLGGVFTRGGYLYEILTWSLDSGNGMDDFMVFRSSTGELAIYKGTDPTSIATFALVSVYYVSPPVGNVSSCDLGGDSLLLTRSGLVPISKIVQGEANQALYETSISKNISKTLNEILGIFGVTAPRTWQIQNIPELQAIMIVIPKSSRQAATQFIMNVITGAWAEYSLPASSLIPYGTGFMFGTDNGRVCYSSPHDVAYKDNVRLDDTGGKPVEGTLLTAFSDLGDPTRLKHFKMVRPTIQALTQPLIKVGILVDFDFAPFNISPTPGVGDRDTDNWDSALWDSAHWSSSLSMYRPWTSVNGLGYYAALMLRISNISRTSFTSVEVIAESGGMV